MGTPEQVAYWSNVIQILGGLASISILLIPGIRYIKRLRITVIPDEDDKSD